MTSETSVADAFANPYPAYARLRAAGPVHWDAKLHAWLVLGYAEVAAALRDDARFSADRRRARRGARTGGAGPTDRRPAAAPGERATGAATTGERATGAATTAEHGAGAAAPGERGAGAAAPAAGRAAGPGIRVVSSDPPECLSVRALLNDALAPKVRAIAPRIESIVAELLEGLAARPAPDLVADFAYALPIRVIAELLDVPEGERDRFQELSRRIARGMDRFYGGDEVRSGLAEIGGYFAGLVAERRDGDGDDVVSRLLRAERDGDRLAEVEAIAMCTALVFGGHETTVNLIANGVLALLRQPAELERLRAAPALLPSAVEELLRFESPPQFVARVVAEPTSLGGRELAPRDSVLVGIGAANRDPAVFPDPDRLDLGRAPNPHVAFGLGTHFCPGAQLSRLEARAALGGLIARFPVIELAGEPQWRPTFILRGLERLPLRLGR